MHRVPKFKFENIVLAWCLWRYAPAREYPLRRVVVTVACRRTEGVETIFLVAVLTQRVAKTERAQTSKTSVEAKCGPTEAEPHPESNKSLALCPTQTNNMWRSLNLLRCNIDAPGTGQRSMSSPFVGTSVRREVFLCEGTFVLVCGLGGENAMTFT